MDPEEQDFVVLDEDDVQDFNPEGVLPVSSDELVKIHKWLAPTDYAAFSSEWGKHRASRLPGTGTWILEHDLYRQWHDSDHGGLWIKAVAGTGKSVLAATIVSKLIAEEKVPVLYFFFRHIVSANQKPKSLVCDFLDQVLQYSPKLQNDLSKLINEDGRSLDSMSLDELWETLISTLTQLPRTYCVVDALDEMDVGNESFVDSLVMLTQLLPTSIKVFMTSRPVPRIEPHFRNTNVLQLVLQPQLVNPDISVYIKHRINEYPMRPQMRSQIHEAMYKKADGHFLYARLMMDEILSVVHFSACNEQKVLKALDELPTPMADMYTQMLLEHSRRSQIPQGLQIAILQWITRAERPLRLLELSSLINVKMFKIQTPKDAKSIVREACGPLLEIFADETVHPIHHSFTEYLYDSNRYDLGLQAVRFPVLDYQETQRALAISCLEHLASGWHFEWLNAWSASNSGGSNNGGVHMKNKLKLKYPYLEYALQNWDAHVRKAQAIDPQIVRGLRQVITEDRHILQAWLSWKITSAMGQKEADTWSPLHAAADRGIASFVKLLVQEGCDLEQLTSTEHTALSLAARNGHYEVVQVLLEYGARNNHPESTGLKPLHYAAKSNHWEVTKVLLEAGVDPLTIKTIENPGRRCGPQQKTKGDTPLKYACSFGHLETVKVITPYLDNEGLQQALWWALTCGHTEVALELLQWPSIDVNYYHNDQTPLYLAARMRDLKLMRMLIDMGANATLLSSNRRNNRPQQPSNRGRHATPLDAYTERVFRRGTSRSEDMNVANLLKGYSMLLDAGVDPNMANANGATILHALVEPRGRLCGNRGEKQDQLRLVLEFLLKRGLSPSPLARDGSNALHLASKLELNVIDLLLDYGVDIDMVRKRDGKTPLMAAIVNNDMRLATHLLKKGASAKVADSDGNTPLHLVALANHSNLDIDMVRELIIAGAAVNSRNHDGDTLLHLGQFGPELTRLLMQHGFAMESKNKLGQTPLFRWAAQWSIDHLHQQLGNFTSDLSIRDNEGRTLLHALLRNGNNFRTKMLDVLRYFVEKGIDPKSTDAHGNNLWHVLASLGPTSRYEEQRNMINILKEYDVSPTARNNAGQTPLHIVFSFEGGHNPYGIIEYLLEHCIIDLDIPDYDQVRPLHLAATFDTKLTCFLLEHGANVAVTTKEGQTPLIVACRARQCDIVCVLLDYIQKRGLAHLIDQADRSGQTALHHACRSGRPESVAMLLAAGASVHSRDQHNATPLHACADYLIEDMNWQKSSSLNTITKAGFVLSTDLSRPQHRTPIKDPIRIRETIRLLVEYGADTSISIEKHDSSQHKEAQTISKEKCPVDAGTPLAVAIAKDCSPMVSELLIIQQERAQKSVISSFESKAELQTGSIMSSKGNNFRYTEIDNIKNFRNRIDLLKVQYGPEVVADLVQPGESNLQLVEDILMNDGEPAVKQMTSLGANFRNLEISGGNVLMKLASWGFANLLYGLRADVAHMTAAWAKEVASQNGNSQQVNSILYTALTRRTPNMAVVRAVVTGLRHDVNEMFQYGGTGGYMHTYTHLLARPSYWWQTQALAYLLDHGAIVDLPTSNSETSLIIALREVSGITYDPVRTRAVEILLEHGANPNATTQNGLTCLNIAARQPKFVELLLKHGANPLQGIRPFLLDAIEVQNVDMITALIAQGVNVNAQSQALASSSWPYGYSNIYAHDDIEGWCKTPSVRDLSAHAFPIHFAASKFFNLPHKLDRTLKIIEILLRGGANPFLTYNDGTSILHCLARHGGIVEPFLSLDALDIEFRDGKGHTLLLAACDAEREQYIDNRWVIVSDDNIKAIIGHGASITVTDDEGRNALHYLVSHFPQKESLFEESRTVLEPFLSSLLFRADKSGRTPYHYALDRSHVELIQLLLTHGSDPAIPDPINHSTALHHLAPLLTHLELLFKEFRATIPTTKLPVAQLQASVVSGSVLKIADLASTISPEQLVKIERYSSYRLFASLLERGLFVNHQDINGETPVLSLAEKGAPYANWIEDKQGSFSDGLLHNAFQNMNDFGADFRIRNRMGESVLHKLAKHSRTTQKWTRQYYGCTNMEKDLSESFKWLVSKGVDVTWEDNEQRTCLDIAAASGAQWLMKLYERE